VAGVAGALGVICRRCKSKYIVALLPTTEDLVERFAMTGWVGVATTMAPLVCVYVCTMRKRDGWILVVVYL
jgi:hypothetical protein